MSSRLGSPPWAPKPRHARPAAALAKLNWPHKRREGQLAFLCPSCQEYRTAVNPQTNLGRCFHCERNFNPIDITMAIQDGAFVEAVTYLTAEFMTQANSQ